MIALSALPVLAIGSIAYYSAQQALTAQIIADDFEQARELQEEVARYLEERADDVESLVADSLLQETDVAANDKATLLEQLRMTAPIFTSLALWGPGGNLLGVSGGPSDMGQELPRSLRAATTSVILGNSANPSEAQVLHFVAPIRRWGQEDIEGWMSADLPTSEISKLLRSTGTTDDEYVIIDRSGKIIVATQTGGEVGRPAGEIFPQLESLVAARSAGSATVSSALTGQRYVVAYVPGGGAGLTGMLNWGMFIGTSQEIALAPQRRLFWLIAAGTTVTALIAGLISILSTKRATRDLVAEIERSKETEAALARARDFALKTARMKSEFLANMSHEIRTPLNGIVGMSGLLMETGMTGEQREFAEIISSSADALIGIVNDILDFSKASAGKLVLEEIDFEPLLAVEGAVDVLAERAHQKSIELAFAVDPDVPQFVRGDVTRLRQVLTNLVGNAVKFTERGEVVVRVGMVSATDNEVVLQFQVTDTGIGIDSEAQSRLFEAFSQADGSTTRKYGGTGLGLAISKQLVEMMHGQIEVRSAPGKGSTFQFSARFGRSTRSGIAAVRDKDLAGMRMLIVDDNATNRQILQRQLSRWGIISDCVINGAQALTALRERAGGFRYDMAILDLEMPGMDGAMLAQLIKTDAALANTRLIIMSSRGGRVDCGAKPTPVDAWLTKPVKPAQLLQTLAVVCDANVEPVSATPPAAFSSDDSHVRELRRQVRLLLAEDNPIGQKVGMRQLRKLGYAADLVENGKQALEALSRTPYSIVLMDCQMPELDGYEATMEVRKRESGRRHTIVVAMTANALKGDRERCLAAGMDDYVTKPVKLEELSAVLDRWLPQALGLERSQSNGGPPGRAAGVSYESQATGNAK
jgi:signal transduction histidine kinase/DNA-binding response OmpR family regulator